MKKKVLLVSHTIRPGGGPPGYLYNLYLGIQECADRLNNEYIFWGNISNNRSSIFERKRKEFSPFLKKLVKSIFLKLKINFRSPAYLYKLISLSLSIKKVDVVIIHGPSELYLSALKCCGADKLILYMPHSPVPFADEYRETCIDGEGKFDMKLYWHLYCVEKSLIERANVVVFASKNAGLEYVNVYDLNEKCVAYIESGIKVVPCGYDDTYKFSEIIDECNKKGKKKVLFAGRYVRHKGFDLYCDAARIICNERNDIAFFSAGDGPLKHLITNKERCVLDFGWIKCVHQLISNVDLVVIPNRVAYYDLLVLEVASLGKPIVMTAIGGNVDQISVFPDVIGCSDISSNGLASAIQEALERLDANCRWGRENMRVYNQRFTVGALAHRWDGLIQSL
ncbi:MAG: glycosyltransferase family 4 protein [Clostridia bacterium]|nr:glycosyltransferase family 4 protein [Clostridia bacterium]